MLRLLPPCAVLLSGLLMAPDVAWACDFSRAPDHEIEADSSDVTPPSAPQAELIHVERGKAPEGCLTQTTTSCDDVAYVELALSAQDDVSTDDAIGYEVEVSGDAPEDFGGGTTRVVRATDGVARFHWLDGEGTGDVSFDLHIRSVDRAGNVSDDATIVQVRSGGAAGCATGRGHSAGSWLLVLLAALVGRLASRREGPRRD